MNSGSPKLLVIPNGDITAELPESTGQNQDAVQQQNCRPKKRKFSLKSSMKRGALTLWRGLVHVRWRAHYILAFKPLNNRRNCDKLLSIIERCNC